MTLPAVNAEQVPLQEILGYLNFSSGAADPAFLRRLNELWGALEAGGIPENETAAAVHKLLANKLAELSESSPAFRDPEQARAALKLIFAAVLPAYRKHHRDLLFHQPDGALWRPFFIGVVAEAVLSAGGPWDETERIVDETLRWLNDFLGHRPVAVLENHRQEPYPHERVRPVPLYIRGAGVAVGKYHDVIEQTLAILRSINGDLLDAAGFDPELLDELSLDPRAYDFNHPANRRPNYHFGQWDPHLIDNKGNYRRFVVQQCTLDAVLARVEKQKTEMPREQLLFEAGAVLAGTILMAAGTSGSGPEAYDSSVSLATLLPKIALYRDQFYQGLLATVQGEHRKRLDDELASRRQPFAGARQSLNAELSRLRALQMQHVHLALLFARLGFAEAATRQAEIVPAVSARMLCQLQCLLTGGQRHIENGQLAAAFADLEQFEALLQRAIACGAVIDPASILGFGAQFSLFPAIENSIPDPRADELIDLIDQAFSVYGRLWHEAATADDAKLQRAASAAFRKLAQWWDRFATTAVSGIKHVSGRQQYESAQRVAAALAAWHQADQSAGTAAFWRPHVEAFDSPQAYSRVIEVLLDQPDLSAAMALLMHWLGEAERIGLDEGPRSFYALVVRWLQIALERTSAANKSPLVSQQSLPLPRGEGRGEGALPNSLHPHPALSQRERVFDPALVFKLFDYLEANAESYWQVPQWQLGEFSGNGNSPRSTPDEDDELAGPAKAEQEQENDLFSAAYEDMVYRDSTADGFDADMLEGPGMGSANNDEFDRALQRISARLAFLAMLAALWKNMALAAAAKSVGSQHPHPALSQGERVSNSAFVIPDDWLAQATDNARKLLNLASAIYREPLPAPSANYDAMVEYDRRRLVRETLLERVIATIVSTMEAEALLAAEPALRNPSSAAGVADPNAKEAPRRSELAYPFAAAGPKTIGLWSAVLSQNPQSVRKHWSAFLAEIAQHPLLYVPLSRGGDARKIAQARAVQQTFRELLARLPRLGLLRKTCQLIRVARIMEKEHSLGAGAVTEFDRLFEIGYKAIVESVVESSLAWEGSGQRKKGKGGRRKGEGGKQSAGEREGALAGKSQGKSSDVVRERNDDPAIDAQLIDCLQQVTEALLSEWLSHSRTLRLSVLERINSPKAWQELVKFIQRYGHDLFTQQFFHLGNLRAILHQGVDRWLEKLLEDDDTSEQFLLLRELDNGISRADARKHLSLILEAIVENYAEYRDYNATTTQSDRGELLHMLLDFLRLKVAYERIHWNLRPVIMAHEVLIRRGATGAAELWRRAMAQRTGEVADEQLKKLATLQGQTGIRLATISDRLGERFVRPLTVDRVRALVAPAAAEARALSSPAAEPSPGEMASETFALLEQEASELAQEPCGAGLDPPDWLEALEQEVNRVCQAQRGWDPTATDSLDDLHWVRLTWEGIQTQLSDWDSPPEMGK